MFIEVQYSMMMMLYEQTLQNIDINKTVKFGVCKAAEVEISDSNSQHLKTEIYRHK